MFSIFCSGFRALSFMLLAAAAGGGGADPSADQIIKKAEQIRNPAESFVMKVSVSGGDSDSVFEVFLKGNSKTLIKTLEPARDRGRNLLMLNEDMWAYVPNLNRSVRVSLSQKLTGQAANGDLSRTRWSGDYESKIEGSDDKTWRLYLKANKKGLTYDRVRVWIEKKTFRPQQAEYLSLSDKVLKKVDYSAYKAIAGAERPTEILIRDAVNEKDRSVLRILSMEVKNNPDSLFNQNNLK